MFCTGSSPQARGARSHPRTARARRRLIPAGAGSTSTRPSPPSTSRAHPRRRGEHLSCAPISVPSSGSSPQARGARVLRPGDEAQAGLIPAGAGSTPAAASAAGAGRAHPRRRGEHAVGQVVVDTWTGSSPQARGAHRPRRQGPGPHGLIPAGAGSTDPAAPTTGTPRAHPRRRGEHVTDRRLCCSPSGSSPQARGAHFLTRPVVPRIANRRSLHRVPLVHAATRTGEPYVPHQPYSTPGAMQRGRWRSRC